jgi:hypothetical protein
MEKWIVGYMLGGLAFFIVAFLFYLFAGDRIVGYVNQWVHSAETNSSSHTTRHYPE